MNTGNTAFSYTGAQGTAECMVSRLGSSAPRTVHGLSPLFVTPPAPHNLPLPLPPNSFLSLCVCV